MNKITFPNGSELHFGDVPPEEQMHSDTWEGLLFEGLPDVPRCHPERRHHADGLCVFCYYERLIASRNECRIPGCLGGRRCPAHREEQ